MSGRPRKINDKVYLQMYFLRIERFEEAKYGRDRAGNIDLVADPPLTNLAIIKTSKMRKNIHKNLPKPDVILSSILLESIQTANIIYPNRTVCIAPFLKEIGSNIRHCPRTPCEQAQILFDMKKSQNFLTTDYQYVIDRETKLFKEIIKPGHYNKFLFWLGNTLIPDLKKEFPEQKHFTIAVFGHSKYIEKYLRYTDVESGIVEMYFHHSQNKVTRKPNPKPRIRKRGPHSPLFRVSQYH